MDRSSFPGGREHSLSAHLIGDFCLLLLWPVSNFEKISEVRTSEIFREESGIALLKWRPQVIHASSSVRNVNSQTLPREVRLHVQGWELRSWHDGSFLVFLKTECALLSRKTPSRPSQAWATLGPASSPAPLPSQQLVVIWGLRQETSASFYSALLNPVAPSSFWWWGPSGLEGKWEAAWSLRAPVIQVPTPVPVFSEVVIRRRFVIDTYINR